MTWNYRIVRDVHKVGDEEHESFSIREVYYEDGKITSWADRGHAPSGDDWIDCADDHAIMGRAIGQPIVDVSSGKPVEVSPLKGKRAQ